MIDPATFIVCPSSGEFVHGQPIAGTHLAVPLRITTRTTCETAGSISTRRDGSRLHLRSSIWLEHGVACAPSEQRHLRQALITVPEAGRTYSLATERGELALTPRAPSSAGCALSPSALGSACERDCELGRDCVAWMGDDPTLRRCQIRCDTPDMRCPDGTTGHCAEHGTCDEIGIP
ncbi:MAG: hypothetical protein M3Y87_30060 [Myxococcota bacterium]|nr:hypothetical protein [Myxococcota bacterium]